VSSVGSFFSYVNDARSHEPEECWLLSTIIHGVTSRKIRILLAAKTRPNPISVFITTLPLVIRWCTVQSVPLESILKLSRKLELTQRFGMRLTLASVYIEHLNCAVGGCHWYGVDWNTFKGGNGRGILLRCIKAHS